MSIFKSLIPSKEYRKQIETEVEPYDMSIKALILGYESAYIGRYLLHLRHVEWYESHKDNVVSRLLGGGNWFFYRICARKTGFQIPPFTCAFGLRFYHWGWCIVNCKARIGKNAVLYPGVCIGQKSENEVPIIGDNCIIGLGAKVIGGVRIGNNVTIAPNAVVTHDVPDNAIVGGIPAKIIRYKS